MRIAFAFMVLAALLSGLASSVTTQAIEAKKTNQILERIAVAIEECNYDSGDK